MPQSAFSFKNLFLGILGLSLFRKVTPALVSVVFVIYVAYLTWCCIVPEKPVPDSERKRLTNIAVSKIVEKIRIERRNIRKTVLLHFDNDPTDYFTHQLRRHLNATGILNLEAATLMEKLYILLNLRPSGCSSLAEALERAKGTGADGVLWGTLTHFETYSKGSLLKGEWWLADVRTGVVISSARIQEDTTEEVWNSPKDHSPIQNAASAGKNTHFLAKTASRTPWHIRFLGFVLLVLLLPIVTISFIRTMVAKRSNKINAWMLGIYTVIGAILAYYMIGCTFSSIWTVLLFLLSTFAALAYNWILMNFALKLEV